MDAWLISYYLGAVVSLALCFGLGPLFYIPMILNIGVEVLLGSGLLQSMNLRMTFAIIGFLYALWACLIGNVFRSRYEAIIVFTLIGFAFWYGIYPSLTEATRDWDRWVELTTRILRVWSVVIVGVIGLVFARTYIDIVRRKGINDLIINPRKRFLIPMAVWATMIAMTWRWIPGIGEWVENNKFHLGSTALVWGWAALELKFFLQARYWRRKYGQH